MANNLISDAVLVKNYIEGDESALSILIERHQSKIYGFIYTKIQDRDMRILRLRLCTILSQASPIQDLRQDFLST